MEGLRMISLYDGQLTDINPNLKGTPASEALSLALRDMTRLAYDFTQRVNLLTDIDKIPEKVLDLMALELRTQYYKDDLDIEIKRGLVSNSLVWYMTAGTPAAVEELVSVVFGEGTVEEWFEYGGEPFMFRIKTNAVLIEDMVTYFSEMIRRVKNTRSHIEAIEIHRGIQQPYYASVGVMNMYKPAAIIDGYNVRREAAQTLNAGVSQTAATKPEAIMEDLKLDGQTVTQTIYAAQALYSKYNNTVKEE
jgi:P2-related tail formation protein